jgi:hypothetical protein
MLLFFAGMFMMIEGAVELGLMRKIASMITTIITSAPQSAQLIAAVEVSVRRESCTVGCGTEQYGCGVWYGRDSAAARV